jgi:hypothetical protein
MITRALRLFEELGDLDFVRSLQEVSATQETSFLPARQDRHDTNFLAEANSLALVIIDSTFD